MSAEDRIRLIEDSLRCLRHSWLSLIPVVGLALGVANLINRGRIRRRARTEWNPAANRLVWSFWIIWLGILLSIAETGLVVLLLNGAFD